MKVVEQAETLFDFAGKPKAKEPVKIKVELKDWLFNAGVLGLYRIFQNADKTIKIEDNYLEFELSDLDDFEKDYFNYFAATYKKNSLWFKLTEYYQNRLADLNPNNLTENDQKAIDGFLKEFEPEKLWKTNENKKAIQIITEKEYYIFKLILEIKKEDYQHKLTEIKGIYNFYLIHRNHILARFSMHRIISNYWGQKETKYIKSPFNKNVDPLIAFKSDFVLPINVLFEGEKKNKAYANCLVCNMEIPSAKVKFDGLTWLGMDLDTDRKTSVYWNNNCDIIICPICHLIYSCVPAGFLTMKQKGLFINDNTAINRLISINALAMESFNSYEELENIGYHQIITMIENYKEEKNQEQEFDNIQVVKYSRGRGYSFNLLSRQLIKVVKKSKKELAELAKLPAIPFDDKIFINVYNEVITSLYSNISLYPLLGSLIKLCYQKKINTFRANLVYKINLNYIGGKMDYKKIAEMKTKGEKLKEAFKTRDQDNKTAGIAYRLLNSLKTKNANSFIDVIINSHMHLGLEVPTLFTECLNDTEKFQAYGYAFVLGFTGHE